MPPNLKYGTVLNKTRASICTSVFEKLLIESTAPTYVAKNMLVILCDELMSKDSRNKYVPFKDTQKFWTCVSEAHCKCAQSDGRMDPALKLYTGIELMLTKNVAVARGEANGTRGILEKVFLKPGQQPFHMDINGRKVPTVRAGQVDHLILRHVKNSSRAGTTIKVLPEARKFQAQYPLPEQFKYSAKTTKSSYQISAQAIQLPVVVNTATTGYKLQGCSVDNIYVVELKGRGPIKNWEYVMLSRVKTRGGLFLKHKIPEDPSYYALDRRLLVDMLARFKRLSAATAFDMEPRS